MILMVTRGKMVAKCPRISYRDLRQLEKWERLPVENRD